MIPNLNNDYVVYLMLFMSINVNNWDTSISASIAGLDDSGTDPARSPTWILSYDFIWVKLTNRNM